MLKFMLLGLCLLGGCLMHAETEKRPITPHDLWALKRLGSPAVSPDGLRVVFTVQEWSVEGNKSETHLWLLNLNDETMRRLTTAKSNDGSPMWSPDGSRIAFVSKRGEDEQNALYVIPSGGGEAEKILELPYPIQAPKWMPDGKRLVFATRAIPELAGSWTKDDLAAMKKEVKRRKDSKISARASEVRVFRFWDQWVTDNLAQRLLILDLESKALTDLTPDFDRLFSWSMDFSYDLAPDGSHVAIVINSTLPPYQELPDSDIYLIPTDGSGEMKNITAENPGSDFGPVFSSDSSRVYYHRFNDLTADGAFAKLWYCDLATGAQHPVTEHLDFAIGQLELSADPNLLWATSESQGRVRIYQVDVAAGTMTEVYGKGGNSQLKVAGDWIVFLNQNFSRPDELHALNPATSELRQLTRFNESFLAQLDLGEVQEYRFTGAAGDEIQGWLILPPGFDPEQRYPLVQLMHGGPHTMVGDAWSYRWNAHVLAAPGYAVTWVNRHGSTGFGEAFCQSILREWGVKPLEDILKSTDHLLARYPNLDPERLAAAGASFGGYMAVWVAGHTDRFACIINHAGVNDVVTQYGSDTTNYSFSRVLGGNPWNNPEGMQRNNPTTYAANFKTPMLIIHGLRDYRVPYVNGTALYGIYQAMGLSARLVLFPDENHWILTPQNAIYWNWEVQSWLSRHIGGTPVIDEPVFNREG